MAEDNGFAMGYALGQDSNGGGNSGGGWGNFGEGLWAVIILAILFGRGGFGGGFGGFGGGGGGSECCCGVATQADLAAGFNNSAVLGNLNDLKLGQAGIQQTLCQGFGGINTAIGTLGFNTQAAINGISREIGDCCCQTQRAIDGVNYNIATQFCALGNTVQTSTRDIIDSQNAGTRAILDFLTQDKIATLTAENQSLKFQASQAQQNAFITANQEAQTAELIRRIAPVPVPSYTVPAPYPYGYGGNNCGCGCG